jgi:hypothetical protein
MAMVRPLPFWLVGGAMLVGKQAGANRASDLPQGNIGTSGEISGHAAALLWARTGPDQFLKFR